MGIDHTGIGVKDSLDPTDMDDGKETLPSKRAASEINCWVLSSPFNYYFELAHLFNNNSLSTCIVGPIALSIYSV